MHTPSVRFIHDLRERVFIISQQSRPVRGINADYCVQNDVRSVCGHSIAPFAESIASD